MIMGWGLILFILGEHVQIYISCHCSLHEEEWSNDGVPFQSTPFTLGVLSHVRVHHKDSVTPIFGNCAYWFFHICETLLHQRKQCYFGVYIWGAFKKKRARGLGTETSTCMSEVLALAAEALVPLRHKAVNGCLVKFLRLRCEPVPHLLFDVIVRGESFAPQSLFRGPKMVYSQGERSGLYGGWPCWTIGTYFC